MTEKLKKHEHLIICRLQCKLKIKDKLHDPLSANHNEINFVTHIINDLLLFIITTKPINCFGQSQMTVNQSKLEVIRGS